MEVGEMGEVTARNTGAEVLGELRAAAMALREVGEVTVEVMEGDRVRGLSP